MTNPVLVEVLRGGKVESHHRGAVAIRDADGASVRTLGDVERPIFPRSAVKAIQALPLIESGAADHFGFGDAELALACASHGGEPVHVNTAAGMLARAGREETCLECGAHWPMAEAAARALAARGETPRALHNNCSGKHAGFVCTACHMGIDPMGYVDPAHPVMAEVTAALEAMTGFRLDPDDAARDGCSIPSFAIPLSALARAFARFGSGTGLSAARAAAARRLRGAVAARPEMVAGEGRFDTIVMRALGEGAFVKVGAEGVYCAALPEQGLGIALKIDDGATRAGEVAMAALLIGWGGFEGAGRDLIVQLARPALRNWSGRPVGELRPAPGLETGAI